MGQWRRKPTGLQKFPRVEAAIPIRIATVDAESDPTTGRTFFRQAEEATANLSRGGAYVHSWEPLAAGRRVVITIQLPDEQRETRPLELEGRVVWTRRRLRPMRGGRIEPAGFGVQFVGGSRSELDTLDRFLNRLQPRASVTQPPAAGVPRANATSLARRLETPRDQPRS